MGVVRRLLHATSQCAEGLDRGTRGRVSCLRKYTRRSPSERPPAAQKSAANGVFRQPVGGAVAGGPRGLSRSGPQSGLDGRPETLVAHSLRLRPRVRRDRRGAGLSSRPSFFAAGASSSCSGAGSLDHETEAFHGVAGGELVHAAQELVAQVGELVGPDRRAALHGEDAARRSARGRAPAATWLAGGAGPGPVRPRLVARGQAGECRVEDLADAARLSHRRPSLRPGARRVVGRADPRQRAVERQLDDRGGGELLAP